MNIRRNYKATDVMSAMEEIAKEARCYKKRKPGVGLAESERSGQ